MAFTIKPKGEIIICGHCGGSGNRQGKSTLVQKSLYDSDWEKPPVEVCPFCNGMGRLLKITRYTPLAESGMYFDLDVDEVRPLSADNGSGGE